MSTLPKYVTQDELSERFGCSTRRSWDPPPAVLPGVSKTCRQGAAISR